MNERIKELAFEVSEITNWKPGLGNSNIQEYLEKFAELIVKEVFTKIEDERFEVYQPVKESVMKHFGIEE